MIITKQKEINKIINSIDGKSVFIIGCSECATLCHTGGEEEVKEMKKILEKENIKVTGWVILDPACHLNNDRRMLKSHKDEIDKSEKILVLACGNGIQTVSELIDFQEIIPGTDTLFLGEIKRANQFEKRCNLCGECIQDLFEGLCPISRCPKKMLNGPCGGSIDGKCEINKDLDCIWQLIYDKLKSKNKINELDKLREPKDWSKSQEFRRNI
jgi:ferredoxin